MRIKATESAVAVFLSMLLCASLQARTTGIDNTPQRQEPAGEISDTLRLTLTDVFTRIENENRTMAMLRSAQEAAVEGIKSAKNAKYPEINAELNVSYIGDCFLTDRNFSNFTKAPSPHLGLCRRRCQCCRGNGRTRGPHVRSGNQQKPSGPETYGSRRISGPVQDGQQHKGL